MVVAVCAACSQAPAVDVDAPAPLRPGVNDSSQAFMGSPNDDESAFLTAMRDGDDTARAAAVTQLTSDLASDPTNGYSAFLVGASYFIPPHTVLAALAAGTPPPQFRLTAAATPYLKQELANVTDPFYLGFGGGLLAQIELSTGDTAEGQPTLATAATNNRAATEFIDVIDDLVAKDTTAALADMYTLLEYCNGGPLDHAGADAAAYVAKQNAGTLAHRQCYSGFFSPHGSSGEILILADLHALNGDAQAATAYYTAVQSTDDYPTWPLKPLVERRLAGTQVADIGLATTITTSCTTCHTNSLP
jgi:hypothetical protein